MDLVFTAIFAALICIGGVKAPTFNKVYKMTQGIKVVKKQLPMFQITYQTEYDTEYFSKIYNRLLGK